MIETWRPARVLIQPELEMLQLIADYRGWSTVAEIYLNKEVKKRLTHNAIIAAREVEKYMEGIYAN